MRAPEWNLLITCDADHETIVRERATAVLQALGVAVRFHEGARSGTLEARVAAEPRDVVRQVEELARRDPRIVAHTHHWRPIDAWSPSDIMAMRRRVAEVAQRVGPSESWRLTVQVHGPSPWHRRDLVAQLADVVEHGRVRLDHAAKELRVDVLGDHAAVSLLAPGEDLSVDRVREAGEHVLQET